MTSKTESAGGVYIGNFPELLYHKKKHLYVTGQFLNDACWHDDMETRHTLLALWFSNHKRNVKKKENISIWRHHVTRVRQLGPLLLTRVNFNHRMEK